MSERKARTTYEVQLRNPKYRATFGRGAEFRNYKAAIQEAKRVVLESPTLRVRIVEVTRTIKNDSVRWP